MFLIYYVLMQTLIFFVRFTLSNNLISNNFLELISFSNNFNYNLVLLIFFLLLIRYGLSVLFIPNILDHNVLEVLNLLNLISPKLHKILCYSIL
jgi:hypothetical protein